MTTNILHQDTGITDLDLWLYNKTGNVAPSGDPVMYGDVLRRIVNDS